MPTSLDKLRQRELQKAIDKHGLYHRGAKKNDDYIRTLRRHGIKYVDDLNKESLLDIIVNRGEYRTLQKAPAEDLLDLVKREIDAVGFKEEQ